MGLIVLGLTDRRRRVRATNQLTLVNDRQALRFLLRHSRSGVITIGIVAMLTFLFAVALVLDGIFLEPTNC